MTKYQAADAAPPQTNEVVVAVFVDQDTAEQAIAELRQAGLPEDDIVVLPGKEASELTPSHSTVRPAQGAFEGALSGGIVGAALGLLGALLLPGVAPEVAGGLVGVLLAGGLLGAVAGGLIGALVTFATGQAESDEHQPGTLVTVLTDGRSMDARTILGLLWKKKERRNRPSFDYFGPDRRWAGL